MLVPFLWVQTHQRPRITVPSFSTVVLAAFNQFDTDHSGDLGAAEINKAVFDPEYHGAQAAAVAALHEWIAADKDPIPTLNRAWFLAYKPVPLHRDKSMSADDARKAQKAYAASPDSLQSTFSSGYRRLLGKHSDSLYTPAGLPSMNDIKQGALGDCYMLAPLGAMVHRDPNAVAAMLKADPNATTVQFGNGQSVTVPKLTDAQLAMGGASDTQALWVRVIENAYGNRYFKNKPDHVARDVMNGGSIRSAGLVFTGHWFDAIRLVGDYKKSVEQGVIDKAATAITDQLPKALADHKLALASTPAHEMPKSISPNHAYAVFGFDATAKTITLWNPHSNKFTPKGLAGLDNGYKVEGGVFTMPLADFIHTFGSICIETDLTSDPKKQKRKPAVSPPKISPPKISPPKISPPKN